MRVTIEIATENGPVVQEAELTEVGFRFVFSSGRWQGHPITKLTLHYEHKEDYTIPFG